MRGCPSLVGGRPAKSVALWAARVQIPHPAPFQNLRLGSLPFLDSSLVHGAFAGLRFERGLNGGVSGGLGRSCRGRVIDFELVEDDFSLWLKSRGLSEGYVRQMLSCFRRFGAEIKGPMDVVKVFSGLSRGQKHKMIRAVRNLFNFYEAQGVSKAWLDVLRKNIPRDEVGVDLMVPTEEAIAESLRKLSKPRFMRLFAVYNLVLDSGLRLVEAVRLINSLSTVQVQRQNGFWVAIIGSFRGTKVAYFGYFTDYTKRMIDEVGRKLSYETVKRKKGWDKDVISYKYLRKFAFDKMIELEVPESVADFIEGRVPKRIGAKHYMALARQANKFYPRYAEYITRLRQKVLN